MTACPNGQVIKTQVSAWIIVLELMERLDMESQVENREESIKGKMNKTNRRRTGRIGTVQRKMVQPRGQGQRIFELAAVA